MFIGFLISEKDKGFILRLQSEIGALEANCKNVERENLHISMSFLGETSAEDAEKIKHDIAAIAKKFRKMKVKIGGVEAIPSKSFVRVIALKVDDLSGELQRMVNEIGNLIGGDVKSPHLTLCRVKPTKEKGKIVGFIEKYQDEIFTSIEIDSIQLIESRLGESGPVYSIVSESKLD